MFELLMVDKENNEQLFYYDQHTSSLYTQGKKIEFELDKPINWIDATKISPENPGKKIKNPQVLKIQLGLNCNYSCSYCLQATQIAKASVSNLADANIFIKNLDHWLEGQPKRIEFWGGEPMLYWKKIQFLLSEFEKRWEKKSEYVIITNGSLLNDEILEFIEKYDINVAISHDGPGQHLRGPDPFDDPVCMEWIKKLFALRVPKNRLGINVVLTNQNYDLEVIEKWFDEKIGPEIPISLEGIVQEYEDGSTQFTDEQYADMVDKISRGILSGQALNYGAIRSKIEGFINSIVQGRPSSSLGQKCGMDRDSNLAVDLLGNVVTCQNVGGEDKHHNIGHVRSFDKITLNTSWHWSYRKGCTNCPVLQLCAGSCMYLEGEQFRISCDSSFYYNLAIFAGAMFLLTGLALKEIRGNIRNKFPDNEIKFEAK